MTRLGEGRVFYVKHFKGWYFIDGLDITIHILSIVSRGTLLGNEDGGANP